MELSLKSVRVDDGSPKTLLPAIALGLGIILSTGYLTVFDVPEDSVVAVVFPPWVGDEAAFSKVVSLGALPIRTGFGGTVQVVMPPSAAFKARIMDLGAWAIVNPLGFGGCGTGGAAGKNRQEGPGGHLSRDTAAI